MVVRAYAVCIGVKPECRWTELEMVGDGQGCADEADEAYHDITPLLCRYVLEGCSASLMSGAGRCSRRGSRRGGWGSRGLEGEFAYSGRRRDVCGGGPDLIRLRP